MKRARERRDTAMAELAASPAARPVAELQSAIDGLLQTPGADGCTGINGRVTRSICPQVATLRGELARAQRRSALEATIAQPLPSVPTTREARAADPGASALSVYLAALGIKVSSDTLTEWLALVPVVALEVGSSLAGILAAGQSSHAPRVPLDTPAAPEKPATAAAEVSGDRKPRRRKKGSDDDTGSSGTGHRVMPANVVDLLKQRGGRLETGQRGLGKLLGMSKSRVNQVLHELAAAGRIVIDTSPAGTRVALA